MSAQRRRPAKPGQDQQRTCAGCGTTLAADNTAPICGRCHREQRDQLRTPPAHLRDDFWTTDEFRAAFESQHIGKVFRAYRNHPRHLKLYGKALNQELLGRWLGLTQAQISKVEKGKPEYNLEILRDYAEKLHIPRMLLWFDFPGDKRSIDAFSTRNAVEATESKESIADAVGIDSSVLNDAASLRDELSRSLAATFMGDASIDEFEITVVRLGEATRYCSPSELISRVMATLTELRNVMVAHVGSDLRKVRIARAIAQLSGLMSLTLVKLNDIQGSLRWAKTSELLAAETGDSSLQSWAYAQEAYCHFYSSDLLSTIDAAQRSQNLAPISVGSALSAAIEARANALLGRENETLKAVGRAESILERLGSGLLVPSAFGYNEAQLRFHQGNALTHLKATKPAYEVQDRALELYSEDDYLDRALVQLDRAECFARDAEFGSASELAISVLSVLESSQKQGLILGRTTDVLKIIDGSAARELNGAIEEAKGD